MLARSEAKPCVCFFHLNGAPSAPRAAIRPKANRAPSLLVDNPHQCPTGPYPPVRGRPLLAYTVSDALEALQPRKPLSLSCCLNLLSRGEGGSYLLPHSFSLNPPPLATPSRRPPNQLPASGIHVPPHTSNAVWWYFLKFLLHLRRSQRAATAAPPMDGGWQGQGHTNKSRRAEATIVARATVDAEETALRANVGFTRATHSMKLLSPKDMSGLFGDFQVLAA